MAAPPLCGAAHRPLRRQCRGLHRQRKRCGASGPCRWAGHHLFHPRGGPERQAAPPLHHRGRLLAPSRQEQDVDPRFLAMLIAYEDKRFYEHGGVDPRALLRAAWQALTHGRVVSGGSTLTMQVARLLEPRPERRLTDKLAEMIRAVQIEQRLTKGQILDLYLTLAPYGGNIEGTRAASLAYFGKEPKRLSTAEGAMLVALPQAPESRRPDRNPKPPPPRATASSRGSPTTASSTPTRRRPPAPRRRPAAASPSPCSAPTWRSAWRSRQPPGTRHRHQHRPHAAGRARNAGTRARHRHRLRRRRRHPGGRQRARAKSAPMSAAPAISMRSARGRWTWPWRSARPAPR